MLCKPLPRNHSTLSGLCRQHIPARHAGPCKVSQARKTLKVTQAFAAMLPIRQPRNPGAHINNGCGDGL